MQRASNIYVYKVGFIYMTASKYSSMGLGKTLKYTQLELINRLIGSMYYNSNHSFINKKSSYVQLKHSWGTEIGCCSTSTTHGHNCLKIIDWLAYLIHVSKIINFGSLSGQQCRKSVPFHKTMLHVCACRWRLSSTDIAIREKDSQWDTNNKLLINMINAKTSTGMWILKW